MTYTTLTTDTHARIRVITLNRPEVRNAMSMTLQHELHTAFQAAETDTDVRAVMLTGTGKAFCAGLDLAELNSIGSRSPAEHLADSERLMALFNYIYTFPKPTVAALNGHAVAGGAGLASVCDLSIMSADAKLGYSEARIGFVAALVGVFLVRQVGEKQARELLLSARLVAADEAYRMGLVNEVVRSEAVLARGLAVAESLTQNAPGALNLTKQLLAAVPSMDLQTGLRYAAELNARARSSAELQEGISAFLEKRPPAWHKH